MRKQLLCLMVVFAAGCGEETTSAPTASTSEASAAAVENAPVLVKFTCPGMT